MSDTPSPRLPEIQDGRYREFEAVGQGGMGVVYLALDTHLGRRVALKVVRGAAGEPPESPVRIEPPQSESPVSEAFAELESRFLREATITGAMEHPGVVPVYELGRTAGGVPYYTMRFVRGARTLRDAEHDAKNLTARLTLLEPFLKVCDTMAYAHDQGVLHRDLKPDNIALGAFGEVVVLDWGLAKVMGQDDDAPIAEWQARLSASSGSQETVAGVIGTPGYLAPELAKGNPAEADPRSDVYSLGVMLFQILSGELPHPVLSIMDYLRALMNDAPPRLDDTVAGVPPALADICRDALAREPEARIASARELATRLRAWQAETVVAQRRAERLAAAEAAVATACPEAKDGVRDLGDLDGAALAVERAREVGVSPDVLEPLEARLAEGRAFAAREQVTRARRRTTLRVAGAAALVLLAGAAIAAWLIEGKRREAVDARDVATTERARAEAATRDATQRLAETYAETAERYLEARRHAAAMVAANESLAIAPSPRAWRTLMRAAYGEPAGSRALASGIQARSLAVDPSGSTLAVGGAWGQVVLYDLDTGAARGQLVGAQNQVGDLAFIDDTTLRGVSNDGTVRDWRTDTLEEVRTWAGPPVHLRAVATGTDAPPRLAGTSDGRLVWWTEAGAAPRVLALGDRASAPDPVTRIIALDAGVLALQASGRLTFAAQDAPTREPLADGARALCADADGAWVVRANERALQRLDGRGQPVSGSELTIPAPDGDARTLALAHHEGTFALLRSSGHVLLLERGAAPRRLSLPAPDTPSGGGRAAQEVRQDLVLLPDGRRLAVTDAVGQVLLYDFTRAGSEGTAPTAALVGHGSSLTGVAVRSENRGLLSIAKDGLLIRWDGASLAPRHPQRLGFGPFGLGSMAYDPVGDRVFLWGGAPPEDDASLGGYRLLALAAETGEVLWEQALVSPPPFTYALALHGDTLLRCAAMQGIERRHVETGEVLGIWPTPGISVPLACTVREGDGAVAIAGPSPDGQGYVVQIRRPGADAWTPLGDPAPTSITSLAMTSSPPRLYASRSDQKLGVFDLDNPSRPARWIDMGQPTFALRTSTDGSLLYVGGRQVHVLALPGLTHLAAQDGHEGTVSCLALDEAEGRLVTSGFDGSLRLWTPPAAAPAREIAAPAGAVASARGPGAADMLVLGQDGVVQRIDTMTHQVLETYVVPRNDASPVMTGRLAVDPTAARFAVITDGGPVSLFALGTSTPQRQWQPRSVNLTAVCFDARGEHLFLGTGLSDRVLPPMDVQPLATREYEVLLWPLTEASPTKRWVAHRSGVRTLARTLDDRIVSGGDDGFVKAWTHDGPVLPEAEAPHHVRAVVGFFERGGVLFSVGAEGEIRSVDASPATPRAPGFWPVLAPRQGAPFLVAAPATPFGWNPEVDLRCLEDPEAFDAAYRLPDWGEGLGDAMLLGDQRHVVLAPGRLVTPGRRLRRVDLAFLRMSPSARRVWLLETFGLELRDGAARPRYTSAFVPRVPDAFPRAPRESR